MVSGTQGGPLTSQGPRHKGDDHLRDECSHERGLFQQGLDHRNYRESFLEQIGSLSLAQDRMIELSVAKDDEGQNRHDNEIYELSCRA